MPFYKLIILTFGLLPFLALGACTEIQLASHVAKKIPAPTSSKNKGRFKVGSSYKIKGQWYRPAETYKFTQTGMASWYGPNFHGKKTANGETFDMYALTAAHKTLQMPSIIRVTNLNNGKSAIFRVNDRGPFSKSRVLDVSKRGAQVLGFENQGTTKVRIELLDEESRRVSRIAKEGKSTTGMEIAFNEKRLPRPFVQRAAIDMASASVSSPVPPLVPLSPNGIYVQTGAFGDAVNAQKMVRSLRSFGHAHVKQTLVDGRSLYRVRFGPLQDSGKADLLLSRLEDSGRLNAMVIID